MSGTYSIMTLTANELFACMQYALLVLLSTILQLLVMYHGAPLFWCAGSMVSGEVWMYIPYAQSASRPECRTNEKMG